MSTPVFLTNLTWPQAEALLAEDDRLLLVTGATEQHGHHLPLGTDNAIPLLLAERLSAATGVPIAPTLPIGNSESFMAFPGTLTLSEETTRTLFLELVQSCYRPGWRRLFVLNGHGGNRSAWEWVAALATKIKPDLKLYLTHWWREPFVQELVRERMGRTEGHAGLEETAMMLVAQPELVQRGDAVADDVEALPDTVWTQPDALRHAVPSGAFGIDPSQATAALGEAILQRLLDDYLPLLDGEW
ncbi:MAG: creatininase family protein [Anaerolineales bacterium]|nr:creatininase family protein [Anaerolineales bacterium]MCB9128245.1 creatininase family protein [Ardenticatenales bacterium]